MVPCNIGFILRALQGNEALAIMPSAYFHSMSILFISFISLSVSVKATIIFW